MKRALAALIVLAGCQDDVATPFPPGLEPLEDNLVEEMPDGPFVEMLRTRATNSDFVRVHGRGFVRVPPTTMWAVAKSPLPNVQKCKTDEQRVTIGDDPAYEFSFLVHYVVYDFLTVEWDDQWRFGTVDDSLAMIKHQKVQGSDFISLSAGTIQVLATKDPDVTELVFVEHLDAVSAGTGDVLQGMQYNYDALVAAAHGNSIPPCR